MQILPDPAWDEIHARFGTRVDGNTSASSPTLTSENGAVLQGELVPAVEALALRSDPIVSQTKFFHGQHGKQSTPALGHFLQASPQRPALCRRVSLSQLRSHRVWSSLPLLGQAQTSRCVPCMRYRPFRGQRGKQSTPALGAGFAAD